MERHRRERQSLDDEIAKEKERIKKDNEAEKKKKEQQTKQAQQNFPTGTDTAYQSFVKDSLFIEELNEKLKELLNQK